MKKILKWIFIPLAIVIIVFVVAFIVYSFIIPDGHPKNPDAATLSLLSDFRRQAPVFYQENTSYANFCTDTVTQENIALIDERNAENAVVKCFSDENSWVSSTKLLEKWSGQEYICVDSLGNFKGISQDQENLIVDSNSTCLFLPD